MSTRHGPGKVRALLMLVLHLDYHFAHTVLYRSQIIIIAAGINIQISKNKLSCLFS